MKVPINLDMLTGSEVMVPFASPPCCYWKKQELASNAKARQEGVAAIWMSFTASFVTFRNNHQATLHKFAVYLVITLCDLAK